PPAHAPESGPGQTPSAFGPPHHLGDPMPDPATRGVGRGRDHFVSAIQWLSAREPFVVALLAPLLLFPSRITPAALAALPLAWLARRIAFGRLAERTRADGPIVLLLATSLVSTLASSDLYYSLPKLCGIVIGVAVYYSVANVEPTTRMARWLAL